MANPIKKKARKVIKKVLSKSQKETKAIIDKRIRAAIEKAGGDGKSYSRAISNKNLKSDKPKQKKKAETTKKVRASNKATGAKGESQTQKNVRFRKKYDIQEGMGLDAESGGSRRAAQDVDQGKAGTVTQSKGKNFVESQMTKAGLKRAKTKVSLEDKVKKGDATKSDKTKLKKLKDSDAEATRRQQGGRRSKVKLEKGDYVNTQTGEVITDPKSLSDLKGGRNMYVKDPTPPRMAAIKRNAEARSMTKREREMGGLKAGELKSLTKLSKTPKGNVAGKGGTGRNRQNLNMGGLTKPTANQTGLKKLPTAVRNKMGYMYGGGMAKKPRKSMMDYRKGGLVIMIGTAKKGKK